MKSVKIILFLTFSTFLISCSASDKAVWGDKDCKKISDASGFFLSASGKTVEESGERKKEGDMKESQELFMASVNLSQIAANYAKTYEVYCKEKK